VSTAILIESIQPNPAAAVTTIGYTLRQHGDVAIELFDLLGTRRSILFDGMMEEGHHTIAVNASDIAPGMYICRVKSGNEQSQRILQIVR
jgi:hypothetical protein